MTPCDILAIGAHPDDVELGCGGTLARCAAAGHRVGILDLTAGELATRGDPATRKREAAAAATALGAAWRECPGLPDGGLDAGDAGQVAILVAAIRAARPRVVLGHHPDDPHPDHGAAAALVARAAFLAGVRRFAAGTGPHRPGLVLRFPGPRQLLAPAVVVDVSDHWDRKRSALEAYRSQFAAEGPDAAGTTHLSSGFYLAAIEGRDRATGNTAGVELGEGLLADGPLPADEIAWMLAAGR